MIYYHVTILQRNNFTTTEGFYYDVMVLLQRNEYVMI